MIIDIYLWFSHKGRPGDGQGKNIVDNLQQRYPLAWNYYVKDYVDAVEMNVPKFELDEMITHLIKEVREHNGKQQQKKKT